MKPSKKVDRFPKVELFYYESPGSRHVRLILKFVHHFKRMISVNGFYLML